MNDCYCCCDILILLFERVEVEINVPLNHSLPANTRTVGNTRSKSANTYIINI